MNYPNPARSSGLPLYHGRKALAPIIRRRICLATSAAALALVVGCSSAPRTSRPLDTMKYTLENTEDFELVDPVAVRCTGLQEHAMADGRLEVVANLKNLEKRRSEVQVSCLFRDRQGLPTGEETPWQTVMLPENATEAVRFTAANATAKKYTIRVRQPRS